MSILSTKILQVGVRQALSYFAWPAFFAVLFACNFMASQARDQTLGRQSGMEAGLPKLD
jgi:hypothetical protein